MGAQACHLLFFVLFPGACACRRPQDSSDAVRPEELADSLLNLVNSDNSFRAAQPLYGSMSKIDSNHRVMHERAHACVHVCVCDMDV